MNNTITSSTTLQWDGNTTIDLFTEYDPEANLSVEKMTIYRLGEEVTVTCQELIRLSDMMKNYIQCKG